MKKIIVLFMMLILSVTLVGCSNKNHNFSIAYEGKSAFGFDDEKLTYCLSEYVSTREKLETLSKKFNNGYFDELSLSYNSEMGLMIRKYDDEFFKDNSLVICVIDAGNHYNYSVNKLEVRNSELIINIKKTQKKGIFTDEAFAYSFIIEVEKTEFSNIKSVNTIVK